MLGSCALTAAAGVAGGGVIIHRSLSSSTKSEIAVDNSPKKMDGEEKEEPQVEDISVPEGLDVVRNLEGFECRVDGTPFMVTQDKACVEESGYDVSQEGYLNPNELDDDEIQIDSLMEQMSN